MDELEQIKIDEGSVFAHTNRSLLNQKAISVYSVHPYKTACRPTTVIRGVNPASLVLSDAATYFATGARKSIVQEVKARVEGCEGFSKVRRVVYGGICGTLEDYDVEEQVLKDLLDNDSFDWKIAYFPATFPNEKQYSAWLEAECEGESPIKGSFWEKTLDNLEWHYVEEGYPSPQNTGHSFQKADFVLLLGSNTPLEKGGRGLAQWKMYVSNPQ